MSIEKCAASDRTPAECYVKKYPLKTGVRKRLPYQETSLLQRSNMSIEKCAASDRTPAECYVKKYPLKTGVRKRLPYQETSLLQRSNMSIEKCAASDRTPAECYVKKYPLKKKSMQCQKLYTPMESPQGDLVLRNSRILCFLLQIRCG